MKIVVTGTRTWTNRKLIETVLDALKDSRNEPITLLHGGASGADFLCACVGEALGFTVIKCKADWKTFGYGAGLERNIHMLQQKPDAVFAFKRTDVPSRGTEHCIAEARRRNIPVHLFLEP